MSQRVHPAPIAISSDGKLLAVPVPGPAILLYDLDSGKVVDRIATDGAMPLSLRFMDHDRKLQVIQAKLGERYLNPKSW